MPHGAALAPTLTPHGRLCLARADEASALPEDHGERLRETFDRGAGHGLRQLGAGEVATAATDRAFRIGPVKNVLVQQFVCRGPVEEKMDGLVEAKQKLPRDLREGGAERLLAEMKDDGILDLVALDRRAAPAGSE